LWRGSAKFNQVGTYQFSNNFGAVAPLPPPTGYDCVSSGGKVFGVDIKDPGLGICAEMETN
jgi:hypothetical protein